MPSFFGKRGKSSKNGLRGLVKKITSEEVQGRLNWKGEMSLIVDPQHIKLEVGLCAYSIATGSSDMLITDIYKMTSTVAMPWGLKRDPRLSDLVTPRSDRSMMA